MDSPNFSTNFIQPITSSIDTTEPTNDIIAINEVKNNVDELDLDSIQITQEVEEEKRSSVVIHEDLISESSQQLNTQSLDDLECDTVAMIELESSENILGTSDVDKMNSIKTDTTYEDETPKASTFQMAVL